MRNENCFRKRMKVLLPVFLVLTAAICLCAVHSAAQGNVRPGPALIRGAPYAPSG